MYRDIDSLPKNHYNLTLHQGGLGDLIAQLPVIKYILENHSHNFYHLWIHEYAKDLCIALFSHHKNLTIRGLSEISKYKNELFARSPYAHRVGNLASHLTEHAFYTMLGRSVENEYKNYIQMEPIDANQFSLPEKYIVVTTGYTSDTRQWLPESVNGVTDYIIEKGYTPVYLGKSYTQAYKDTGIKGTFVADYSKGINLIDKTNLFEAHAIMADATAVLGLDNGLIHLAGMSSVPIIAGFTTVDPLHRLPYRDGVLGKDCYVVTPTKEELACIHCQSNMSFAPESHTFTKCFYKDYKCLELMGKEKWIAQLEKIL